MSSNVVLPSTPWQAGAIERTDRWSLPYQDLRVTQLRLDGRGRVYYQMRLDANDTRAMALRALKRRICRAVYGRLREDHRHRHAASNELDGQ